MFQARARDPSPKPFEREHNFWPRGPRQELSKDVVWLCNQSADSKW